MSLPFTGTALGSGGGGGGTGGTPDPHAASHENGGADELALDASQITTGTIADARLPSTLVDGPGTSVDSEVALFDGTGGVLLKRASVTGLAKLTSGVLSAATAGTDYSRYEGPVWTPITSTTAVDSARRYYAGLLAPGVSNTSTTITANRLYLASFFAPSGARVYSIATYLPTGVASALLRLGIYASGSDGLPSGSPLAESGDLDADGTPNWVEYVLGTPLSLTPGRSYYTGLVSDSAVSVRSAASSNQAVQGSGPGYSSNPGTAALKTMYKAHTYGALPSAPNSSLTSYDIALLVFVSYV